MDLDQNALSRLPRPVQFHLKIVFSLMVSAIFCTNAEFLVESAGHILAQVMLIFFGVFGTSFLLRASRASAPVPVKVVAATLVKRRQDKCM
jgi:hypothetical protein